MTVGSGTPGPGRQAACRWMCGGFPYASVRIAPTIAVVGGLFSPVFPFPPSIPHFLHAASFARFRPRFQAAASSPVRLPSSSSASLCCSSRHGRAFLHGWCWLRFIFLSFTCSFLSFFILFADLLSLSLLHWCAVCW